MFSSQACSTFRCHQKISPCRWSISGRPLTQDRGSSVFFGRTLPPSRRMVCFSLSSDEPFENPSQLLLGRKSHPKRHLACAIVSSLFFFATGQSCGILVRSLTHAFVQVPLPLSMQSSLFSANAMAIMKKQ